MSDEQPKWRAMSDLAKAIEEDNQNCKFEINAKPEDVNKCISDLTDKIAELKQDVHFLSNEIMKMEHLQDDEKIMKLFRKYNE